MKKRKNSIEGVNFRKNNKTAPGAIEISSQTKSKTNGQSFSSAQTRNDDSGQTKSPHKATTRHDANLRILDTAHYSSAQRAYADE